MLAIYDRLNGEYFRDMDGNIMKFSDASVARGFLILEGYSVTQASSNMFLLEPIKDAEEGHDARQL